jgi:hypothetical protein
MIPIYEIHGRSMNPCAACWRCTRVTLARSISDDGCHRIASDRPTSEPKPLTEQWDVLEMPDDRVAVRFLRKLDLDHIEPKRPWSRAQLAQVSTARSPKHLLFPRGNREVPRHQGARRTGFHLDEHQHVAIAHHKIDLFPLIRGIAPVAGQRNESAAPLQVGLGQPLALRTCVRRTK